MVPHPATWQADRERERQVLLRTAARYRREANALAATVARSRASAVENAHGRRLGLRAPGARRLHPVARPPRGRRLLAYRANGARHLARLFTMFMSRRPTIAP